MCNPDNATTGEQHRGRQRSDSAEPHASGFPRSSVSCETIQKPLQLFHRNSCKIAVYYFRETRRGGLVRPASKSCRFSHHPLRVPKAWHRNFAACGQRSGLLALNLANIFEKLLDQKTFICLPACCNCPVALLELTTLILMIQLYLNWTVSKNAIAAGKTYLQIQFASQMWAARPHLGSIFEKLLHRKTF